jgi:2-C-methyl-D-erythritol 4-phosphate cytidylyltransferase
VRFAAIVVAAGRGIRFGRPKQLIDVAGRPLVAWSLATFGAMPEIADLVIATEEEHLETMATLAQTFAARLRTRVLAGGATRQESAWRALGAVPATCDAAFIHDGARPLVDEDDVRAGMLATAPGVGALLAAPVVDTIKVVADDGRHTVMRTLDRATLWAAQTPQFGALADLRRAHELARERAVDATDDASLLERAGCRVVVIPARRENFKVTHASDRLLAEAILYERAAGIAAG